MCPLTVNSGVLRVAKKCHPHPQGVPTFKVHPISIRHQQFGRDCQINGGSDLGIVSCRSG